MRRSSFRSVSGVAPSVALTLGGLLVLTAIPALAADPSRSPAANAGPADGASPGSTAEPATIPLEGTTWRLTNARLSGAFGTIPEDVTATLLLQDGQASGSGGCNAFSGPYTLDGTALSFGNVHSTLRFCEGPGGTVETFYFADLPAVASWAIDGHSLTLSADDGQPVLAYAVQTVPDLEGSWVVTAYADQTGIIQQVAGGSPPVVVFAATTVDGTAGCNGFHGPWSVTLGTLGIGPLLSTKKACEPAEVMAREAAIIADLVASTSAQAFADGNIDLLDDAGVLRLTLTPATGAA